MEKWIAAISGVIGSIVSYAIDGLGLAVTVLIVMMIIDYITGLLCAIINKNLNSRIGYHGIIRKFYYLLMLASIYAISFVIPNIEFAGDGAAISLCVLELISITENGAKIGLPVPKFVQNLLLAIREKTDESGDNK
jgi:toxin secretion/phage lysis holin